MRVLILSVTAGYGHNNSAYALSAELESRGASVIVEDFYKQVSYLVYGFVDKGYQFSVRHMRRPYKTAYASLERYERARKIFGAINGNKLFLNRYAKYLEEHKPDVIIATHVFAAVMLNTLKKNGVLTTPVLGINTDYCIQPFWEETHDIEYIITGSELLNYIAIKKGIPEKLLLPLGLPIRSIFQNTVPKAEAREQLGLDPEMQTVLVMSGSMGYGDMQSAIQEIDQMQIPTQMICICGRNEKLKQQLEELSLRSTCLITGFVENVSLYMDAADCIITKPGGLTVTEVLSKRLPMILVDPIPGHEERNAEFFVNNGAAMQVSEHFSVAEAVYYMFSQPQRLQLMQESLSLLSHPRATEDICDFIENLVQ